MIQNDVVSNIVLWNGDTEQWTPPSDSIMLVQETTLALGWQFNSAKNDYELVETVGTGDIGDTWNGVCCITNKPKPEVSEEIPVTITS